MNLEELNKATVEEFDAKIEDIGRRNTLTVKEKEQRIEELEKEKQEEVEKQIQQARIRETLKMRIRGPASRSSADTMM